MYKCFVAILVLCTTFVTGASLYAETSPTNTLPERSLYRASLRWLNDRGEPTKLEDYYGKYVVITMAYTSCGTTCPLTVERLKKIEKAVLDHEKVRFVVVSFDSERDTPKKMAEYKAKKDVNWDFLIGEEDQIRTLSLLLGISYEKNPLSGEINHGNKILLLDPQGVIAVSLDGLNSEIEPLVERVNAKP